MDRAALDAVERALVGVAVFLEPALEQYDDARFAAGGRTEQQQQASADFRARARRAEIVGEPLELVVDAEKIFGKQFVARGAVGALFDALPADHVPDVLVAAARDGARVGGKDLLDELGKSARPIGRPVLLGEGNQTLYKVAMALSLFRPVRHTVPSAQDALACCIQTAYQVLVRQRVEGSGFRTKTICYGLVQNLFSAERPRLRRFLCYMIRLLFNARSVPALYERVRLRDHAQCARTTHSVPFSAFLGVCTAPCAFFLWQMCALCRLSNSVAPSATAELRLHNGASCTAVWRSSNE